MPFPKYDNDKAIYLFNLNKKSNKDKNYDNLHSGIYHSRMLLWTEKTLDKAIKKYEKLNNVKIKKNF